MARGTAVLSRRTGDTSTRCSYQRAEAQLGGFVNRRAYVRRVVAGWLVARDAQVFVSRSAGATREARPEIIPSSALIAQRDPQLQPCWGAQEFGSPTS